MTARTGTLTVAFLLAIGAAASAAQSREDLRIFNDISRQVNRYTQFTIFDSVERS